MPRDASETRSRLLDAAEELFARRGVYAVATSEIIAAAGQRNASAVTYHFGSRQNLLRQLLVERDSPIDAERGRLLAQLDDRPDGPALLKVLVVPYTSCLMHHRGRNYLRVIDQVRDGFAEWRSLPSSSQPNLALTLARLEKAMSDLEPEIQQERLVGMMLLMTSASALRAQRIEAGQEPALTHDEFVGNLTQMLSGVIEPPP